MQLRKLTTENKIWLFAIVIAVVIEIILLAFIPLQKWLWLGWMYGTVVMLLGHLLSSLLIELVLKKAKTKKKGILISFGSTLLNYVFQIAMFIVLWISDNVFFGDFPWERSLYNLENGPINIFAYFAGLAIIVIATISTQVWEIKSNKEK